MLCLVKTILGLKFNDWIDILDLCYNLNTWIDFDVITMSNNVPVQTRLLKVIQEEIENALDAYPNKFCRIFFTCPNLRQDLLCYVLCKLSNNPQTVAVKQGKKLCSKHTFPYYSLEMRLHLESYIREGMNCLLSDTYHGLNFGNRQ